MILVLTVGSGTAGQPSNLAAGLLNSINSLEVKPTFILLVPSTTEESTGLAELVSEECTIPSELAPFELRIEKPDDLLCARKQIRACLESLRKRFPGKNILVNPTSGTKQMTIGCFLAAAEIPGVEICFISGPRQDGVIITGAEKNLHFEPNLLHRERALSTAEELFKSGALEAIHPLLSPYGSSTEAEASLGLCLSHRQSLRLEPARQTASKSQHPAAISLRSYLNDLCSSERASPLFVAEVFSGAERLRHWGKDTAAFLAYYQSIEFCARTALVQRHQIREEYECELIANAPNCSGEFARRLRANSRNGKVVLGLHGLHEALQAMGDSHADAYFNNQSLRTMLNRRNEFVHTGQSPESGLVLALANHARAHLLALLPEINLDLPASLWPATLLR